MVMVCVSVSEFQDRERAGKGAHVLGLVREVVCMCVQRCSRRKGGSAAGLWVCPRRNLAPAVPFLRCGYARHLARLLSVPSSTDKKGCVLCARAGCRLADCRRTHVDVPILDALCDHARNGGIQLRDVLLCQVVDPVGSAPVVCCCPRLWALDEGEGLDGAHPAGWSRVVEGWCGSGSGPGGVHAVLLACCWSCYCSASPSQHIRFRRSRCAPASPAITTKTINGFNWACSHTCRSREPYQWVRSRADGKLQARTTERKYSREDEFNSMEWFST